MLTIEEGGYQPFHLRHKLLPQKCILKVFLDRLNGLPDIFTTGLNLQTYFPKSVYLSEAHLDLCQTSLRKFSAFDQVPNDNIVTRK